MDEGMLHLAVEAVTILTGMGLSATSIGRRVSALEVARADDRKCLDALHSRFDAAGFPKWVGHPPEDQGPTPASSTEPPRNP